MATMIYDTLKLSKTLQRAFSTEQAEALTEALSSAGHDNLATKLDINELEMRLIKNNADLKSDLVRWIVTAIAFNFVATAGLVLGLVKFFAH